MNRILAAAAIVIGTSPALSQSVTCTPTFGGGTICSNGVTTRPTFGGGVIVTTPPPPPAPPITSRSVYDDIMRHPALQQTLPQRFPPQR